MFKPWFFLPAPARAVIPRCRMAQAIAPVSDLVSRLTAGGPLKQIIPGGDDGLSLSDVRVRFKKLKVQRTR
jgi:hypothetical protein